MNEEVLIQGVQLGKKGGKKASEALDQKLANAVRDGQSPEEIAGLINTPHAKGTTVLHRACENGDPDTLHVLLKHGGSPNVRRRSSLAGVDVVAALPQRWVAASGTRGGGLRWARSFVKRPTCGPPIEVGTAILPAHDARILRVVLLTWIGTRRFDSSHIRSQERSNSPQCGVRQCGSAQQQCGVRSAECTHSGVGWPSTG